ncbi:uncharacterized protein M6D78_013435 isoform 1-T1 [Vipera latastei]
MARPLQDRSLAEPTATVSRSSTFPVGGTLALPPSVCRPPLALPPGLNCLYRCGRALEPPGSVRVSMQPTAPGTPEEAPTEPEQSARGPNGHLPRTPLNLEQAIGAQLRHMGDRFHQDHEQRVSRRKGAGSNSFSLGETSFQAWSCCILDQEEANWGTHPLRPLHSWTGPGPAAIQECINTGAFEVAKRCLSFPAPGQGAGGGQPCPCSTVFPCVSFWPI